MTAAELRRVVAGLEARFRSYDGGDRPQSPPVRLMRELFEAREELSRAERSERESTMRRSTKERLEELDRRAVEFESAEEYSVSAGRGVSLKEVFMVGDEELQRLADVGEEEAGGALASLGVGGALRLAGVSDRESEDWSSTTTRIWAALDRGQLSHQEDVREVIRALARCLVRLGAHAELRGRVEGRLAGALAEGIRIAGAAQMFREEGLAYRGALERLVGAVRESERVGGERHKCARVCTEQGVHDVWVAECEALEAASALLAIARCAEVDRGEP